MVNSFTLHRNAIPRLLFFLFQVPSGNLRYAVGAILTEGDVKVEPEVQKAMEAEGFKVIILPQVTNCVRAKFPYINTLSIFIAIRKVYPQMNYYIQVKKNEK